MNILLESRSFHPSVGGLETSSELLATRWQEMGHSVHLMTKTPLSGAKKLDTFSVVRRPSLREQLRQMFWCDVFVQSGVSLRSLPVALMAGRPVLATHRDFLKYETEGWPGLARLLKRGVAHFLIHNVAVSHAVAEVLPPHRTTVIHNAFRPLFERSGIKQSTDERSGLLFVGRLVTEKGADVAIDALALLHERGMHLHLTICGDGPERSVLETQVRRKGLEDYVVFAGVKDPEALLQEYSRAEVVLMPSRNEPFGNVAVEALACGTPVVAAEVGGLPEAVGPGGLLFPSNNPEMMAARITESLEPGMRKHLLDGVGEHLKKHRAEYVSERYINVLMDMISTP